ncbi:hypothetical protein QDY28_29135 [Rhizobium sp. BR 362]
MVVWNIASHHPDRCLAVANLCIPYATFERGLDVLVGLVNRDLYPQSEYPFGNWEYQRYYEEHFEKATSAMEANVAAMLLIIERHYHVFDFPNVGKRCQHRFRHPDLLRFEPKEPHEKQFITRNLLSLVDKGRVRSNSSCSDSIMGGLDPKVFSPAGSE